MGGVFTGVAVILLLSVGYGVCIFNFGMPPPVVVCEVTETPQKLQPKIVTENRPCPQTFAVIFIVEAGG